MKSPVQLIGVAIFLTVITVGGLIFQLSKSHTLTELTYRNEIPLSQNLASGLRRHSSLNRDLERLIKEKKQKLVPEFLKERELLRTSGLVIRNYTQDESTIGDVSKIIEQIFAIQDMIISAIKDFKFAEAQNIYTTRYLLLHNKLTSTISKIEAAVTLKHEARLVENERSFRIGFYLSLISLLILGFLWYLAFFLYRKIEKDRIATQIELEGERQRSAHTTKMSALGEMAGCVAHEINTPLAVILGSASLALKALKKEPQNLKGALDGLTRISEMTQRIAKIVKSLKTFSRADNYALFSKMSVPLLIDEVVNLSASRFTKLGINLEIDIVDAVEIDCNVTQIQQILLNLLNNSCDAIELKEKRWIKLRAYTNLNNYYFRVVDCGEGIPPDTLEKLMQPFFTTKAVGIGTGLGLSLSRDIADKHNGNLAYEFFEGHTSFVLKIPIKQKNPNSEELKAA